MKLFAKTGMYIEGMIIVIHNGICENQNLYSHEFSIVRSNSETALEPASPNFF